MRRSFRPNPLFSVWTPDTVAECLDGVGPELYAKLWTFVEDYKKVLDQEEPIIGLNSLTRFWHRLSMKEQAELNRLAVAYQKR